MNDKVRQLEEAIAALEVQRSQLGDSVVNASVEVLKRELEELRGEMHMPEQERKLATLLFLDIVGSTEFGQHYEPDVLLDIIDEGLKRMAAPILAYHGRVTRFTGDGFKSVFGVPIGWEDDAARALRAALEILQVAEEYAETIEKEWGVPGFKVRIGINTGMVATGGYSEAEDTIMGLTVNMGARVESAAPPGGILVSKNTYQLVQGLFEFKEHDPIEGKGFDKPIPVYQLLYERPIDQQLSPRGIRGIETELVGREKELGQLRVVLEKVIQEQKGQFAAVVGDAGHGKTRLLGEFTLELPEKMTIIKGRGKQQSQNSPYQLVREILFDFLGIYSVNMADDILETLEMKIGQLTGMEEFSQTQINLMVNLIAQLVGVNFGFDQTDKTIGEDPDLFVSSALNALAHILKGIAKHEPVMIFVDDLHWADEYSIEALKFLAKSLAELPVLIAVCGRLGTYVKDHFESAGQANFQIIPLAPLTNDESKKLVDLILNKVEQVPPVLKDLIVSNAEGNPFYIEELIKMLTDQNVILKVDEDTWEVDETSLDELDMPTTLVGVLQARLDQLPEDEKHLLWLAAVVGREFWDQAIIRIQEEAGGISLPIEELLLDLCERNILAKANDSMFPPANEYHFQQALFREVVYESIFTRIKTIYHKVTANWLIEHSEAKGGNIFAMIANHLILSNNIKRSIEYLYMAGQQAFKQYALDEALSFYKKAFLLVHESDLERKYLLHLAQEKIFDIRGNTEEQFKELETLEQQLENWGEEAHHAEVYLRYAGYYRKVSQYQDAVEMAKLAVQYGEESQQIKIQAEGYLVWGRALISIGDNSQAQNHLEKSLSLAKEAELEQTSADILRNLGLALAGLGELDKAKQFWEEALEIYKQIGDRRGKGWVLNNLGNVLYAQGDHQAGQAFYEEFLMISQEIGDRWGESMVSSSIGQARLDQAEYTAAGNLFNMALDLTQKVGNRSVESRALVGLGRVHLLKSEYSQAYIMFEQTRKLAHDIGNKPWEAQSLMEIGRFFHRINDFMRAKRYYEQALSLIEVLGNKERESKLMVYKGLLAEQTGEYSKAEELSRKAIDNSSSQANKKILAGAELVLGHALCGKNQCLQAIDHYNNSLELYKSLGNKNREIETVAALADASFKHGKNKEAKDFGTLVWDHIAQSEKKMPEEKKQVSWALYGLDGLAAPLRVLVNISKLFAEDEPDRSKELIKIAKSLVDNEIQKMPDADSRSIYMQNPRVQEILNQVQHAV